MKRPIFQTRLSKTSGFTLVELLVVIGIIAILAGVLFAAGGAAIRAAQRAKAANLANQLQTSVLSYYTEYSVYPAPTGQAAGSDYMITDADAATWGEMIYALCGNINPYNSSTTAPGTVVPNTRAIAFLTLKSSDVDLNNAPKNPIAADSKNDPYFNLALDYDYDGIVGNTGNAAGKLPDFVNSTTTSMKTLANGTTGGVAVWANCNTSTTSTNPGFYVHTY